MTRPPLAALRIPAGWLVGHNELRAVDPTQLAAGDERWTYLRADLLQLEHAASAIVIDVGWSPERATTGTYKLVAIADLDWQRPLVQASLRSLDELVAKVEELLAHPPELPTQRLVERLTGGTSETRAAAAEALAERGAVETIDAVAAALGAEPISEAWKRMAAARDRLIVERVEREKRGGKRKLQRVGFFRELRYGRPDDPELRASLAASAGANDADLVKYLRAGVAITTSPGPSRDVLAPDKIIGTLQMLTDGTHVWPSDLAHYVARHHARVPDEFVAHARGLGWAVPAVDIQRVEL